MASRSAALAAARSPCPRTFRMAITPSFCTNAHTRPVIRPRCPPTLYGQSRSRPRRAISIGSALVFRRRRSRRGMPSTAGPNCNGRASRSQGPRSTPSPRPTTSCSTRSRASPRPGRTVASICALPFPKQLERGDVRLQVMFKKTVGKETVQEVVTNRVPVVGRSVLVEFFPEGGYLSRACPAASTSAPPPRPGSRLTSREQSPTAARPSRRSRR